MTCLRRFVGPSRPSTGSCGKHDELIPAIAAIRSLGSATQAAPLVTHLPALAYLGLVPGSGAAERPG